MCFSYLSFRYYTLSILIGKTVLFGFLLEFEAQRFIFDQAVHLVLRVEKIKLATKKSARFKIIKPLPVSLS